MRGVVAGRAGHAAARMGARSAQVKAGQRSAVIGVAQHRAGGKQLVQRQDAMKDVAPDETELTFEIERAEDLTADDARFESGGVTIDRIDHQVRHLLPVFVPGPPAGQHRSHVLAEEARHMCPGRGEAVVQHGRDLHLDDRFPAPAEGPCVLIGPVHV
jgi:hypothetical protein